MISIINNSKLTNSMSVNTTNTDESGKLRPCQMLQEITKINDKAIMQAFGHLDFSGISLSRCHVYFHEQALNGDTLKISSAYSYSDMLGLVIAIIVQKTKSRKNITILTGDFTFINNTIKQIA